MGPCIVSIFQYTRISNKMQGYSLFISRNCSTCFGRYSYPSSGAHTTLSTASGICHTVTAICRYRGRVGTGLSVLWVAYDTDTHTHTHTHTLGRTPSGRVIGPSQRPPSDNTQQSQKTDVIAP
jgi:hypothetical protein